MSNSEVGEFVEFDRNRYFMIGVLVLLLGIQFRMVESFVLNQQSTKVLHRFARQTEIASTDFQTDMAVRLGQAKKRVTPPEWLGWAMLTVGGVICLHALVLPKRNS